MRLKKGSKVKVLSKKDMAIQAWRCAEIISGDGRTCRVRSDSIRGMEDGKTMDKVPREAIRPCSPPVGGMVNWASGDIAEVLDAGSWKAATVLKVLDGGYCLVRLLGSFTELKIHKSKTRPHKWVAFGKACRSRNAAKTNNLPNSNCYEVPQVSTRIRLHAGNDGLALQDNNYGQDSYIVSAKSLKRASPFCSSHVEAHPSKVRAIQKRTGRQQVISRPLSPLCKKGQSWRLACLASKGLKMMLGFAPCTWHKEWHNICIQIATYITIYGWQAILLFLEFNNVDHF